MPAISENSLLTRLTRRRQTDDREPRAYSNRVRSELLKSRIKKAGVRSWRRVNNTPALLQTRGGTESFSGGNKSRGTVRRRSRMQIPGKEKRVDIDLVFSSVAAIVVSPVPSKPARLFAVSPRQTLIKWRDNPIDSGRSLSNGRST